MIQCMSMRFIVFVFVSNTNVFNIYTKCATQFPAEQKSSSKLSWTQVGQFDALEPVRLHLSKATSCRQFHAYVRVYFATKISSLTQIPNIESHVIERSTLSTSRPIEFHSEARLNDVEDSFLKEKKTLSHNFLV